MRRSFAFVFALIVCAALAGPAAWPADSTQYSAELDITYCTVAGKELKLNVFLPPKGGKPIAVMVDIHGGWWSSGERSKAIDGIWGHQALAGLGVAVFSISYRLGKEGGFPENICDCRNAIRFIRKNAARWGIDPERIGCMGGSAGSHLSMMVAMVPEDFDDGGPAPGLEGVSAKVSNAFSFVGPTDFVRQWEEAPSDELPDGKFRPADGKIPHDARPRHRILFKGITPDTEEHRALYRKMSPIGHVRKDVAPLLIVDGERDAIVPHQHGRFLMQRLKEAGADATYYMMPLAGHTYPSMPAFQPTLREFLVRTLKLEAPK